jgi:hypothetical protein
VGVEIGIDAMTNYLDDAIARLQDIALALTGVTIKSAPDYPIENEEPLPMSVAYFSSGSVDAMNSTTTKLIDKVNVEFHFSRLNLKQAYQQINTVRVEFARRLHGDPTLNGTVDTIFVNGEGDIPCTVRPFIWRERTATMSAFATQMLMFEITIKQLESPL